MARYFTLAVISSYSWCRLYIFLAIDDTYKATDRERRDSIGRNWFVYSIVSRENSCKVRGFQCIVLACLLISRVTAGGYQARFFRRCRFKVSFITVGIELNERSIELREITTDFKAVEVQIVAISP